MSSYVYWTREKILGAILAWNLKHGEPPRSREWTRAAADHPTTSTVRGTFGTWNAAIKAAGLEPRPPGRPEGSGATRYWTRERILEAIARWTAEHGRPPRWSDWRKASIHYPHQTQVRNEFGSFRAALEAADDLAGRHMNPAEDAA